jgi:hypothetical protein
MNGEATLTRKRLQMGWQKLDVVPHWTARGCFNEVTLELAAKTIAHGLGEELEGLRHDRRVMRELASPL